MGRGLTMPHGLDTDKAVFFYEQEFYVFSNFSAFQILWAGISFPTSEHAYQWMKFNKISYTDVKEKFDTPHQHMKHLKLPKKTTLLPSHTGKKFVLE